MSSKLPAQKFFLYARKSTDTEDKQVLSIESQLAELRAYARANGLNIVEELVERKSAKAPGRPIFDVMLDRIEKGEVAGILAWHPDRLARNSVDGGRLIYLLDCGHLKALRFPTFTADNTSQGKFMLSIAFGQSKYYVDALAENTKRGLRQKVRRGEYPGLAPIGYLNDPRARSIVVDRKKAPIIKQAFELYAQNHSRLEDIADFLAQRGITSRNGKRLHRDRITYMLSNPFYYGHFRYQGEIHEGIHEPVISKKTFDRVQEVLRARGRPHHVPVNLPKPFCGLLECAECGMHVTAEIQKGHTYYRCTKKGTACSQPYVRQEVLDQQLSTLLQTFSLSEEWAAELLAMTKQDQEKSAHSSAAFVRESRKEISAITSKLQRLLGAYLDQDIERGIYLSKKADLMSQKKSLEERLEHDGQKRHAWLEPMQKWIEEAVNLPKVAKETDLTAKKKTALEIFGSNLLLANRAVRVRTRKSGAVAPPAHWAALRAANGLRLGGKIPESRILVEMAGIEPAWS